MYNFPLLALASSCLLAAAARAEVTIYGVFGQTTLDPTNTAGTGTGTAAAAAATTSFVTAPGPPSYTQLAAYNDIYMYPPAIPSPPPANTFAIGVPTDATLMNALSIKQQGTFFGFSIEMSVANQISEYFRPWVLHGVVAGGRGRLDVGGLLVGIRRVSGTALPQSSTQKETSLWRKGHTKCMKRCRR